MNKFLLVSTIIFMSCFICYGQDVKLDSTYFLPDTAIVSASRYAEPIFQIPFSTDIIGPNILNTSHARISSESLFNMVPGIIVDNRNNLSEGDRIIMRGIGSRSQFGVRGIKILLDGIPLTFPDGQAQLNNLDLNSIGRIEIIKGPSSFLYGNASGGVIYIQSKDVNTNGLNVNPEYTVGSYGFQKFSLSASDRIGNNSILVDINKMKYNGFRENSAANSTALNIISTQHFNNDLTFRAIFNYYDAPYLLNPSSLTKSDAENNPSMAREYVKQQGAGKKIQQGQVGLAVSYKPDQTQKFDITLYGILRSMKNPIPGAFIKLNRVSGGVRTDYSTKFNVSKWSVRLLAGGDFEFQNDLRKEYVNKGLSNYTGTPVSDIIENVQLGQQLIGQREKVNGLGIFSKLEFSPLAKTFISLGLRYDRYTFNVNDNLKLNGVDKSGSVPMKNFSQMIGVNYRLNEKLHMFANYSTSFQTPTTSELSNLPTGQGGFNTTLKPEQIRNFELGMRGNLLVQNIFYSASVYILIIDRMLIPYQLPNSQSDEVFYQNSGGAINNGLEFMLTWIPKLNWNISAAFTRMDFKYKNFIESKLVNNNEESFQIGEKRVPGVPEYKASLGIGYKFFFGLNINTLLDWTGKYFVNDMNGPGPNSQENFSYFENDAYFTANLQCDYTFPSTFGSFDFFVGISNLFNSKYIGSIVPNAANDRYFEPASPRNWYSGVSINFN